MKDDGNRERDIQVVAREMRGSSKRDGEEGKVVVKRSRASRRRNKAHALYVRNLKPYELEGCHEEDS